MSARWSCDARLRPPRTRRRARRARRVSCGDGRARPLDPLHDLELDVLEVGLPAGQRLQLGLQGLQLLGVADRAGVQQLLVARHALAHLLDVVLGPGCRARGRSPIGLGGDDLVAQSRQPLPRARRARRRRAASSAGGRAGPGGCRCPAGRAVAAGRGSAFSGCSLRCRVQDRWRSWTRGPPPYAALGEVLPQASRGDGQPRPLAGPVGDIDEGAAAVDEVVLRRGGGAGRR